LSQSLRSKRLTLRQRRFLLLVQKRGSRVSLIAVPLRLSPTAVSLKSVTSATLFPFNAFIIKLYKQKLICSCYVLHYASIFYACQDFFVSFFCDFSEFCFSFTKTLD
jgi:hypothetical protein